MIEEILKKSGVRFRRSRFVKPPGVPTYAVYTDAVTTDGADGVPCIYTHSCTVEVYESTPDNAAEKAMEAAISDAGLQFEKQDRYWLQQEQMYQVIYEFSYITKRRIL
jgi:hypothetical protein